MTERNVDILALIADEKNRITYYPRWNQFTGSINATILLQQIIYRWMHTGRRPFYKFSAPCGHRAYREEDSWQEEVGMSRTEFESARSTLAARTRGDLDERALISYWTDATRKTWYAVNEARVVEELSRIYPQQPVDNSNGAGLQGTLLLQDSCNRDEKLMQESDITVMQESCNRSAPLLQDSCNSVMQESDITVMQESCNRSTEITTEITTEIDSQTENNNSNNKAAGDENEEPVVAVVADGLLAEFGVAEPHRSQYAARASPTLIQAWIWQIRSLGDGLSNPAGYLVARLKSEQLPDAGLLALATLWPSLSDDDRWVLGSLAGGADEGRYMGPAAQTGDQLWDRIDPERHGGLAILDAPALSAYLALTKHAPEELEK